MTRKAARHRAPNRAALAAQHRARELAVADKTIAKARADIEAAEQVLAASIADPAAPDLAASIGRFKVILAEFTAAVSRASPAGLTATPDHVAVDSAIAAHLDLIGLTELRKN